MDTTTAADRISRPLNRASLTDLPPTVSVPSYDVRGLRPGVVHLGSGGFHRAHQAVYFDRLAELGVSAGWAVVGSGLHSSALRKPLQAQDGLYTVVEADGAGTAPRVVGILQRYLSLRHEGAGSLVAAMNDPRTQLVTMTVTAPTYAQPEAPVFSHVLDALARRRAAGMRPFTVLSCDNLPDNGAVTRERVLTLARTRDPALAAWIDQHAAFPSSMVDRITPPVSGEQRRLFRREHGVHDRVPVLTESFSQWVVEDEFSGERPPLDQVGVQLVSSARPYVDMKMRLLNGSHLALGFLGSRAGHRTTAEAIRDPRLRRVLTRLMRDEVSPLLDPVPEVDLTSYRRTLMDRLGNEAVADPLSRLCARGSVRMQNYLVPSLRAAVAQGRPHGLLTLVVAAWISHLQEHNGDLETLQDPAAHVLVTLAARAEDDVRPFLAAAPGFADLVGSSSFVAALQDALDGMEVNRRAAS